MLMPGDDLVIHMTDNIPHREFSVVHTHLGLQDDMKQDIAQFFDDHILIVPVKAVQQFVSLLQEVAADALVSLLFVPGTAVRTA